MTRTRSMLGTALLLLATGCTTSGTLREDSTRHLILSATVAFEGTLVAHAQGLAPEGASAVGGGSALALGLVKESWDTVHPEGTGWGWDDLLCDALGASAGSLLAYLLLNAARD